MSERKFDIILFGVTGLVGRYGLNYLYELSTRENIGISWGVAGRNSSKIRQTLLQLSLKMTDEEILKTPIILADMTDPLSIEEMVKQTKVLLNFCGPLRRHGEVVIQSCINFKTHYLDLSAEPNFIEKIELKYDEPAREAGIYIANSCGFDSLAYEMGIIFLQKNLQGPLNSVETYLRYGSDEHGLPGPDFNTATWNSIVDLLANTQELRKLRQQRDQKWPVLRPKLPHRIFPFHSLYEEGWAVRSPSADLSVMRRTQQYLYKKECKRPIQIESYFIFISVLHIFFFIIFGSLLVTFSKFKYGRKLLLKYPSIFTGGSFTNAEPTEQKLDNIWCSLTLVGKGWKNVENEGIRKPDTEIVARIKGNNTGYKLTGLCLILSGVLLLRENGNLPKRKGVYTPGVLFRETTMIDQLHKNGLKFYVVEVKGKGTLVRNKL